MNNERNRLIRESVIQWVQCPLSPRGALSGRLVAFGGVYVR